MYVQSTITDAENARKGERDKMRRGADLNGDNLRNSAAYLRISDHCRVTVRVRVADCCIQTAGESGDKTRVNHVIKTDQWRDAPQIRRAPHFVVSREKVENQPSFVNLFRFSISASFSSTHYHIIRHHITKLQRVLRHWCPTALCWQ